MTRQTTIFGTEEVVRDEQHKKEVASILEKYPAASQNPGLCAFLIFKKRYPWIAQLDEQQQFNFREFANDWPSLNRRRQEYREKHPVEKKSKIETIDF